MYLCELFVVDLECGEKMNVEGVGFYFDYFKYCVIDEMLWLLWEFV